MLNTCTYLLWDSGPSATPTQGVIRMPLTGPRVGVSGAGDVGKFRHIRFDASTRRKILDATCVIAVGKEAERAAARFLHAFGAQTDSIKEAALERARPAFDVWSATWIFCDYYPSSNEINCGGVWCAEYASRPAQRPSLSRMGLDDARPLDTYTFACTNGCDIIDFAYYYCPNQGGTEFSGGSPTGVCGPTVDSLVAEYTTGPYAPDNFTGVTCTTFTNAGGSARQLTCRAATDVRTATTT